MKRTYVTLLKTVLAISAIFMMSSCQNGGQPYQYKDANGEATYLASFNTFGGSPLESQNLSIINEMPISTKKGYALKGWYIDVETNLVSFPYKLEKDTTFNASWEKARYSCSFETNGGAPVETMTDIYVIETSPVTTREGYDFVGWHLKEDLSDSIVSFPYSLKDNTTLYAEWSRRETEPSGRLLAVAKVDAMEAKSYWSFEYLDTELHIHSEVTDKFIYTYYDNPGMNDNVEVVLTKKNRTLSAGYGSNYTFHFLCDAAGNGYYNYALNAYSLSGNSAIPSSCAISGRTTTVQNDGFRGYIIDFYISYSIFGLDKVEALNNMTMTVGMRNTNSYTATYWGGPLYNDYLSSWSWSLLKDDGTFEDADINASSLIIGGTNFAIGNYHDLNTTLASYNSFVYSREDLLENWEDEAKNLSMYHADKLIINVGRSDYYKGDLTGENLANAVIDFAKYYISAFEASHIYVTSIEPLLNISANLSSLQAVNNSIKNQCLTNGMNYIDTYSLFVTSSSLNTSYFKDNFIFSDAGFTAYYDLIKTYL